MIWHICFNADTLAPARRGDKDKTFTGAQISLAVLAPFGPPVLVADDVGEAADIFIGENDDVASVSAVSPVGPNPYPYYGWHRPYRVRTFY